ncbi:hypothetical protein EDB86DRAFT_2925845 [Lactarius hatsudake]|nr:hypothetical protein EDB86DRAFT_2925845 [Lactarius hatsudake]
MISAYRLCLRLCVFSFHKSIASVCISIHILLRGSLGSCVLGACKIIPLFFLLHCWCRLQLILLFSDPTSTQPNLCRIIFLQ